jgi:hypothetical protein
MSGKSTGQDIDLTTTLAELRKEIKKKKEAPPIVSQPQPRTTNLYAIKETQERSC